jgi:hypothetical protein
MSKIFVSDFYCTQCGKFTYPLPRKKSNQKEAGHLKSLYCIYCKKEINCVEIRPFGSYTYEDFIFEYNNHNFDKEGKRVVPYSQLRNYLAKKEKEEKEKEING